MDITAIVAEGASAAFFSNILTSLFKASPVPSSPIALRVFAFGIAEMCAFVLFFAAGGALNPQTAAVTFLVGVAAAGGATVAKFASDAASPPK